MSAWPGLRAWPGSCHVQEEMFRNFSPFVFCLFFVVVSHDLALKDCQHTAESACGFKILQVKTSKISSFLLTYLDFSFVSTE